MYRLRILWRNLGITAFLKVLTAQFYSKIYYGSVIWLGHVSGEIMHKLESLHYKALCIGCHDYRNNIPRHILDHDFCRAKPSEWLHYATCHEMIRIFKSRNPVCLFSRLESQSYRLNRPLRIKFFDKSLTKVGRQSFANKVSFSSSSLNFDWFHEQLSADLVRIKLKNNLFRYPSVTPNYVSDELVRQLQRHHNRIKRLRHHPEWRQRFDLITNAPKRRSPFITFNS